jgi:Na+-driven multidrug efflux pump
MLGCVLLNVLLNWVLIYGNLGAPALGLEGSGWATLTARTVLALALLAYVTRASALRAFQPAHWKRAFETNRLTGLIKLGMPVGAQHFFEVSAFASAAIMMGWISADAIAAHQIAISCAALTFMSALGIGAAASIRVGHAYGRDNLPECGASDSAQSCWPAQSWARSESCLRWRAEPIAGLFMNRQPSLHSPRNCLSSPRFFKWPTAFK